MVEEIVGFWIRAKGSDANASSSRLEFFHATTEMIYHLLHGEQQWLHTFVIAKQTWCSNVFHLLSPNDRFIPVSARGASLLHRKTFSLPFECAIKFIIITSARSIHRSISIYLITFFASARKCIHSCVPRCQLSHSSWHSPFLLFETHSLTDHDESRFYFQNLLSLRSSTKAFSIIIQNKQPMNLANRNGIAKMKTSNDCEWNGTFLSFTDCFEIN